MPPDSPGQTYQDQAATWESELGHTAESGFADHNLSECHIQGHGLSGLRLKVWPVGNGPQAYMDVLAAAFRRNPGDPWPLRTTQTEPQLRKTKVVPLSYECHVANSGQTYQD